MKIDLNGHDEYWWDYMEAMMMFNVIANWDTDWDTDWDGEIIIMLTIQ